MSFPDLSIWDPAMWSGQAGRSMGQSRCSPKVIATPQIQTVGSDRSDLVAPHRGFARRMHVSADWEGADVASMPGRPLRTAAWPVAQQSVPFRQSLYVDRLFVGVAPVPRAASSPP